MPRRVPQPVLVGALGKGRPGAPAALPGLTPAWSRATRQGTWAFSSGFARVGLGWSEGSDEGFIQSRLLWRWVFFYRFSTSLSFSLKMFLSSPRVDSIFSRENCCSPSLRSSATQLLSSVTVLSRSLHSLTRVSTLA